MTYTYEDALVSDLFKDSLGFRPGVSFMADWKHSTPDQKQEIWDALIDSCVTAEEQVRLDTEAAARRYQDEIDLFIDLGAKTREEAIRWMYGTDQYQDFESFLFDKGLLFSKHYHIYMADLDSAVRL